MATVDGELSLAMVGRALWRSKRVIIGSVLLVTALTFVCVNLITPRYKSEARVLVEGRENIFLRPEADKALMDRGTVDPETVTSQVQLVLSRDLAREVIEELKLAEQPEFNAALQGFSPLSVLRTVGLLKDPMSLTLEERVLTAYYERLNAFAIEKSRVIAIEFQSADPDLAARIANVVAEKYLSFQQMAKQDQARTASRWLSGELENLRDKVSEAEGKVETFRAQSNLFVGSNNTSLSNQQLTELSSQVSAARAQKADAEARARLIRDAIGSAQSLVSLDIANSELIRRLSEQRVTLRGQLAEQSSTLLPQHPRIKEMRAQIADLDQQIRTEGERLARSFENEAKVAGARLDMLGASLDTLKKQTASTSDQDVQLRALEREAKARRDLFESYLAKYREATARDTIAAAPADARIISRAAPSNVPYFPKKIPIVLIAALGTLSLTSAFVVTGALLSAEASRPVPQPVEPEPVPAAAEPARSRRSRSMSDLPAAANVPLAPEQSPSPSQDGVVMGLSVDDVAEALRQAGGRVVAVVGNARNVGTTLTAIALGRALARHGRVVLVDLALHSPNVHVISGEPDAPGIADLVHRVASFGDIITKDRGSRLHLVGAGRVGSDPNALFGSPLLAGAIAALAQSYDTLVIDAGSQTETPLSAIVAMTPHAALVGGETPPDTLVALAADLRAAGFADVAVLTGAPPPLDHAALSTAA
jgi:succinoglycan biosynthesis transport protein ExoP